MAPVRRGIPIRYRYPKTQHQPDRTAHSRSGDPARGSEQNETEVIPVDLTEKIDRVASRSRAFYRHPEPGHYLVNVEIPVEAPPIPPLLEFDLDHQLAEWLDYNLAAARPAWQVKEGLDDDAIPAFCPFFGIAEHSAWLGLEVRLQETTCLPVPIVDDPSDMQKLRCSENDRWFGIMKSSYDHLRGRKDGTFVLSMRGTMTPMDVANAVRGDGLFTDFLLQPDFCHELMGYLVGAIQWYYGHLWTWADDVAGGRVFSHGDPWMPAGTIGHLANDTAMLCSPRVYAEFGFPYESQLVAGYQAVLYHVHNERLHFVPRLAELPHLALLEVTDDPRSVHCIEDLPRILGATGSANLMLRATSDQVRQHIDELGERNVFLLVSCQDRADAEEILAFTRDRSKPL